MADDIKRDSNLPAMTTRTRRTLAKAGMTVSLGALVATGLMGTRRSAPLKTVHLWSGVALVGFSVWHYSLYNKSGKA